MGFFSCIKICKMALTYRRKIKKEGNAPVDELEQNVAQALYDLEQGDLKQDLKFLYIISAKEVTVSAGKSAIVIVIPFRLGANFRKIHTRLIHELEKKFGKNVIVIAQRRILQKPGRNNRVSRQKRPNSRALSFVHAAMLDGSKQLKVYLDKKDKSNLEDKLDTFCAVFKKLTGKDTVFTFESQFR